MTANRSGPRRWSEPGIEGLGFENGRCDSYSISTLQYASFFAAVKLFAHRPTGRGHADIPGELLAGVHQWTLAATQV